MSKIIKKQDITVLIENTLQKVGVKKSLTENSGYFRFDPNGPWYDNDDMSYDELPEGNYEDFELESYEDFEHSYPKHKHFYGHGEKNFERSNDLFNNYKSKYGPLKGKRITQNTITSESKKESKKSLINESIEEYRDKDLVITRPTTHEEMCKYGGGTKWCPAHKSGSRFFDLYNGSQGNFRIYVNRKTDERVAELIDSGKMYDQDDKEIYELPDWAKKQDVNSENIGESKKSKKSLINEDLKRDLERFNNLTKFNYKY